MGGATLQVCQRGGWALFRLFLHLTTKEPPRHVYSNSKPSKQILGHKIMYNGSPVASKSSPDGTQHSERHDVTPHSVARGAHRISYVLLRKDALY